ncbi:hypothetical protein [Glaciimonas sp. PCH181]|uniref:hypothetical protein n=1 Tax=Glaciimonas sp. PCH181 TaxID=2133943 RepID=UPI000D3340B0|nr:hypothetical protein [Glaciimonas sp. PCH181]PUA17645.1 hypothetical protein C7W93_17340 [Glaciimonas sp. PCH181]
MDERLNPIPRYMKIDHIVLSFSDKINVFESNTLYLLIRSSVVDWDRPILATPFYIGEAGESVLLHKVWLEIWASDDMPRENMLAPIIAAYAGKTQIPLPADVPFITQFVIEEDFFRLIALGHLNAVHVYEKLNEFTWMQSVGYRPIWYSDDQHAQTFDPENEYSLVEYDHWNIKNINRSNSIICPQRKGKSCRPL